MAVERLKRCENIVALSEELGVHRRLLQGSLSIERMRPLAGVSRAGFARSLQEEMPVEEDMKVRSAIQRITGGAMASVGLRVSFIRLARFRSTDVANPW
jgi:hypothetical protein